MFHVEIHDHELDNEKQGTLAATVGRQDGLDYEYQAEQHIIDLAQDSKKHSDPYLSRAYILEDGEPIAAWQCHDGVLLCVGHTSGYGGAQRLETPYVHPDRMLLVSTRIGSEAPVSPDAHEAWAREQLVGAVATAVLLNNRGIVFAWERGEADTPVLTARGPQP